MCHSPYCRPYNSSDVSSENLVSNQLIIPKYNILLLLGCWFEFLQCYLPWAAPENFRSLLWVQKNSEWNRPCSCTTWKVDGAVLWWDQSSRHGQLWYIDKPYKLSHPLPEMKTYSSSQAIGNLVFAKLNRVFNRSLVKKKWLLLSTTIPLV